MWKYEETGNFRFYPWSEDIFFFFSTDELLSLPELKENPLIKRVVAIFDNDNSGDIDFKVSSYYAQLKVGLYVFLSSTGNHEPNLT